MNPPRSEPSVFIPGKGKSVVPFMRDVFTIPTNARHRPRLIGSVCEECEEYFFPKTGAKTTCDNPVCPRSTGEVLLSGKGRLLSATITHSTAGGEGERVSAVILLEEGIKINSHLLGWEGYRDMLVPGAPVELVLQGLGENEWGETQVGYAFRLVTGRRKPVFPPTEEEARAARAQKGREERAQKKKQTPASARARKKPATSASKAAGTRKKAAAAPKKAASAGAKAASSGSGASAAEASSAGKAATSKQTTAKASAAAKKKAPPKKTAAANANRRKAASRSASKRR